MPSLKQKSRRPSKDKKTSTTSATENGGDGSRPTTASKTLRASSKSGAPAANAPEQQKQVSRQGNSGPAQRQSFVGGQRQSYPSQAMMNNQGYNNMGGQQGYVPPGMMNNQGYNNMGMMNAQQGYAPQGMMNNQGFNNNMGMMNAQQGYAPQGMMNNQGFNNNMGMPGGQQGYAPQGMMNNQGFNNSNNNNMAGGQQGFAPQGILNHQGHAAANQGHPSQPQGTTNNRSVDDGAAQPTAASHGLPPPPVSGIMKTSSTVKRGAKDKNQAPEKDTAAAAKDPPKQEANPPKVQNPPQKEQPPTSTDPRPNSAFGTNDQIGFGSMNIIGGGEAPASIPSQPSLGYSFGSFANSQFAQGMNPASFSYGGGSLYAGGGMGSMYGMGGQQGGSMYGMGSMMGPMGSMYSRGPFGSMYGMGGMGSMYGMGGPMGSMMGPMGSMFGMDGMMRNNSMPFGSMYGSNRSSSVGYENQILFEPSKEMLQRKRKDDELPPPSSSLSEPERTTTAAAENTNTEGGESEDKTQTRDLPVSGESETVASTATPKTQEEVVSSPAQGATRTSRQSKQINDFIHVVCATSTASLIDTADNSRIVVGDKKFSFDEIKLASELTVSNSDYLGDVVEHSFCGHNVSVIVLCTDNSIDTLAKVVEGVAKDVVTRVREAGTSGKNHLNLSAVAFSDGERYRDLNATPVADKTSAVRFVTNPIFGTCVADAKDVALVSEEQTADEVQKCIRLTGKNEMLALLFKIKQFKPNPKDASVMEVYVSSLLVSFVRPSQAKELETIRSQTRSTSPSLMFTNAVHGASRTVVLTFADTTADSVQMLEEAEKFRTIKNAHIRSGNVRRFVDFSKKATESRDDTDADRREVVEKMRVMLKDAEALLADPDNTPLPVYPLELVSLDSKTKGRTPPALPDKSVNDCNICVGLLLQNFDQNVVSASSKTTLKRATGEAVDVEVDELYFRKPDSGVTPDGSKLVLRSVDALQKGYNAAIIGVDAGEVSPVKHAFTWSAFLRVIRSVITEEETDEMEAFLSIGILNKREVLGDLLNPATAPMVLTVASSPLYGPVVFGLESKSFKNYNAIESTVNSALDRSEYFTKSPDSFIFSSVVFKKHRGGDVLLNSFVACGSPSAQLLQGVLNKDPKYSRSLFSYALGGPCVTNVFVTVSAEMMENGKALDVFNQVKPITEISNRNHRAGSVSAFLEYAKTTEQRTQEPAALEKAAAIIPAYEKLISIPSAPLPPVFLPDGSVPQVQPIPPEADKKDTAGSPTKNFSEVRTIAALLYTKQEDADGLITVSGPSLKCGDRVLTTPKEIVEVKSNSIRCTAVEDLVNTLMKGYNCALLTADAQGCSVGRSLIVGTIRSIFSTKKESAALEVFWSLAVVNGETARDILSESDSYTPIQLATSPLFGPVLHGSSLTRLDPDTQVIEEKIKEATIERYNVSGLAVGVVVCKQIQDGDVLLSSFLFAMAGEDVQHYQTALTAKPKERGLLGYALGGPCMTMYVAGVHNDNPTTAEPLLAVCDAMTSIKCSGLRHGSVRRFLRHTTPTFQILEEKSKSVPPGGKNNYAIQAARVATMVKDGQALLDAPAGQVPQVYQK